MLSVVIPVLNEDESLAQLHSELKAVSLQHEFELDILFVDDGSTDNSWAVIERMAADDRQVRGIRFRRNFGKAAALSAGFAASRADLVVSMDADLQDDPREIPRMVDKLAEGYDVVTGWKKTRNDPWHKVLPSRVFNWMVSRMTGVVLHDHNCGFKCYRRGVFRELRLYGELHRFVPVFAAARGWRIGEIEVNHRRRQHGHSKYGLLRIPKGFLDLLTVKFLTGFGQRPQHLLGTLGLGCFFLGSMGMILLTLMWIVSRIIPGIEHVHLTERAIFFYSLGAALIGAQFMSIGFLAELMTALQGRADDTYSVSERAGGEASWRLSDDRVKRSIDASPARSSDSSSGGPHLTLRKQGESSQTKNE